MIEIVGEGMYRIEETTTCKHCGEEISRGRYIESGNDTGWSHNYGGFGVWCKPLTKASPSVPSSEGEPT